VERITPEETTQKQPPSSEERLRVLRVKQFNAVKPEDWTKNDRQELLGLQNLLDKPVEITESHRLALKRQSEADIGNNPPLTDEEKILIREANSVRTSYSR